MQFPFNGITQKPKLFPNTTNYARFYPITRGEYVIGIEKLVFASTIISPFSKENEFLFINKLLLSAILTSLVFVAGYAFDTLSYNT